MYRQFLSNVLTVAGGCVITLAFCGDVNAFWGHSGGSSGGSWGSSGGSSWGSHGSHGSHGGLFSHWRARRAAWASHGSSGGSWGSSGGASSGGSSGGSHGSWGSSGGSSGGHGGVVPEDAGDGPVETAPEAEAPASTDAENEAQLLQANSAQLTVQVPTEAKIRVNGNETSSTGATRWYVSRSLRPGFGYAYTVEATVQRDGRPVMQTQTITLRAGQHQHLAFEFSDVQEAIAEENRSDTRLTLNVPEHATVVLGGRETFATGAVRVFATDRLNGSDKWEDYTIRVSLELGGEIVSREQSITLNAGDDKQLTFDFEKTRIAGTTDLSSR